MGSTVFMFQFHVDQQITEATNISRPVLTVIETKQRPEPVPNNPRLSKRITRFAVSSRNRTFASLSVLCGCARGALPPLVPRSWP